VRDQASWIDVRWPAFESELTKAGWGVSQRLVLGTLEWRAEWKGCSKPRD
jgi:hypothetical protein